MRYTINGVQHRQNTGHTDEGQALVFAANTARLVGLAQGESTLDEKQRLFQIAQELLKDIRELNTKGTSAALTQPIVVGDSTNCAVLDMLGGSHSFSNGLRIRNNSFLVGCGSVTGPVSVEAGGTILADCGGLLTFNSGVTNNGTIRIINGGVLQAYGSVVNDGVIDIINGGTTNFHGAFINNGIILDASDVQLAQASKSGSDFVVQIQSAVGHTYQLQVAGSLPNSWVGYGPPQDGTGGMLTFTEIGGATNLPARYYRIQVSPQSGP